jgi:lipopolysaccharide biosynthesis glycosyltransferase
MIHITFNIDSNYVRHCAVTMVSILENNRDERFRMHIVAKGLSSEERDALTKLAAKYGSEVAFYAPDESLLKGFEIRKFSRRISLATYYRCILSDLLPADVDRVIYMDCDIVVTGSLKPFWQTPMDEETGAAVVDDIGCDEASRYDILHYPARYSYFNAGVMLVNLDYWRRHNMAQACVDYYHRYPERILFNDQDLLNSLLYDHKVNVDLKWNVQDGFYRNPRHMDDAWRQRYAETLKHPVILHYTNRKPWDYESQHPLRMEYFRYLALTPWANERSCFSFPQLLKRFFRLLPFYLGVRRAKYVNLEKI